MSDLWKEIINDTTKLTWIMEELDGNMKKYELLKGFVLVELKPDDTIDRAMEIIKKDIKTVNTIA